MIPDIGARKIEKAPTDIGGGSILLAEVSDRSGASEGSANAPERFART